MAGNRILELEELVFEQESFKKPYEKNFQLKLKNYIAKFGQFETPIICQVDGEIKFIDHLNFAILMKSLGYKEIEVYDIGVMKKSDFIAFRLFQNVKRNFVDHIAIAKSISEICTNKIDFRNLSNKTNLSEADIEKYAKLLEFDWEEFARLPIGGEEKWSLFDDEIF
jgi:hypothetical protein